jgi:putative tryptophan/tyrosine transport system substrate-binding protein
MTRNKLLVFECIGWWVVLMLLWGVGAADAQSAGRVIGVLTPGLTFAPVLEGLREGLGKLGYRDNVDIRFLVEDSQGEIASLPARAARLVQAQPDVLFTVVTTPTQAVQQATHTLPIVFAGVVDPVAAGLVASFVSSQNNLTGVTAYTAALTGKRLALLREVAPQAQRVLAIVSVHEIVAQIAVQHLAEAAHKQGFTLVRREVATVADLDHLLQEPWAGDIDAVFHLASVVVEKDFDRLSRKCTAEKVPLIVHDEVLLAKGALLSYGSDFRLLGMQSARLVAKILKGEKPADIPVETPEKFVLGLNVTTAKSIGLQISQTLFERIDRMVE